MLVGIQRRGVQLAERLAASDRATPKARRFPAARSTSRSIATTSRPSVRGPSSARPAFPATSTAGRRDRRRRALHRPDRPRGARRAGRLRPAPPDPALRCWSTAAAASCRSRPTSSGRRSRPARDDRVDVAGPELDGRDARRAGARSDDVTTPSLGKDLLGLEQLSRRADPTHSRHRRAVQGDQRAADQEGAGAARQDDRQPVLRGLDPHPHLVRVRREAASRRHGERGGAAARSCRKGETLVDTARNLEAMRIDMVVIRHGARARRSFSASGSSPT